MLTSYLIIEIVGISYSPISIFCGMYVILWSVHQWLSKIFQTQLKLSNIDSQILLQRLHSSNFDAYPFLLFLMGEKETFSRTCLILKDAYLFLIHETCCRCRKNNIQKMLRESHAKSKYEIPIWMCARKFTRTIQI